MSWSSQVASRVIHSLLTNVGQFALGGGTPAERGSFPPMSDQIDVVVNGESRSVAPGTTVAALIGLLGLGDRRVAVERNREVVPRAQHGATVLAAGDRLEVVTFVGGG
jgi:sulfur carrier protein